MATLPAYALLADDEARRAILDLRARVEQMTVRLEEMERQLQAGSRSQLETLNENERLRTEVSRLRGRLDELQRQSTIGEGKQKDFYGDLDRRLKSIEPLAITVDGITFKVTPAEKEKYEAAQAALKSADFKKAAQEFEGFGEQFASSPLAVHALLAKGSALYADKDYKEAIKARQLFISRYPLRPEKPQAMLNLSAAFAESGNATLARTTLEALIKEHPDSSAAKEAKERLKELPKPAPAAKPATTAPATTAPAGKSAPATSGAPAKAPPAKTPQKSASSDSK